MPERNQTLQDIFEAMAAMKRSLHGYYQRAYEQLGLFPSQSQLLLMLDQQAPLTHKELAHRMHLTPGAITQLLEALESAGLVKRQPDDQDRRIAYVSLSRAGQRKIAAIKQVHAKLLKGALSGLDDAELEFYRAIQRKILASLEKSETTT